jgi:hypothetical protein
VLNFESLIRGLGHEGVLDVVTVILRLALVRGLKDQLAMGTQDFNEYLPTERRRNASWRI